MWNMLTNANAEVACAIISNKKRMETLEKMNPRKRAEKLEGYVTAACREVGVKLTAEEKRATESYVALGHHWF